MHNGAVRFLDDCISAEGTIGKMVVTILPVVAQAERHRIFERTNEDRIETIAKGVKLPRIDKSKVLDYIAYEKGTSAIAIVEQIVIGRSTAP